MSSASTAPHERQFKRRRENRMKRTLGTMETVCEFYDWVLALSVFSYAARVTQEGRSYTSRQSRTGQDRNALLVVLDGRSGFWEGG